MQRYTAIKGNLPKTTTWDIIKQWTKCFQEQNQKIIYIFIRIILERSICSWPGLRMSCKAEGRIKIGWSWIGIAEKTKIHQLTWVVNNKACLIRIKWRSCSIIITLGWRMRNMNWTGWIGNTYLPAIVRGILISSIFRWVNMGREESKAPISSKNNNIWRHRRHIIKTLIINLKMTNTIILHQISETGMGYHLDIMRLRIGIGKLKVTINIIHHSINYITKLLNKHDITINTYKTKLEVRLHPQEVQG